MADNIDIVVRDSGVEVVVRDLRQIGSEARNSQGGVDLLNSAIRALSAGLAVDKIMQWADAWNSVAGLVRVATKNQAEANAVTEQLYQVAQKTRQPITEIGTLYNRASLAAGNLGASQEDLIKFTKGVGQALAIQHTTAQQASGSLLQLGQLLGMNTVKAQEYNSLLQNGIVILQTVAKNLNGTGGTVAGLTNMVKNGKLPVQEFFQAFLKGSGDLEGSFEKTSFLFSQGWTVIINAVEKYVGQLDEAIGGSRTFSQLAQFFSNNIQQLGAGLIALGAAIAVAFAPTVLITFLGYLKQITLWAYSNPFTALIAALAALIVYVDLYGDSINAGIDKTTSLKDVGRALIEELSGAWDELLSVASTVWSGILEYATDTMNEINRESKGSSASLAQDYTDFFSTNRTGWAAMLTISARTIDAIAGLLTGLGLAIVRVFTGIPDVLRAIWADAYNTVTTSIANIINAAIDMSNKLREKVGLDLFEHVNISQKQVDTKAWQTYGKNISGAIQEGFDQQGGFMEKWVDGLLAKAKTIGDQRNAANAAANPAVDLTTKGTPVKLVDEAAARKAAKALEELKKQLANVIGEISPAYNAEKHLTDAQTTLTKAVKAHLITQDQADKYMQLLQRRYRDAIDPIGAVTRKLNDEAATYQYVGDAQQNHQKLMEITQDLEKKGVDLTDQQSAAILAQIEQIQELNRQNQAQNGILQSTIYQQRAYLESLDAIAKLKNSGALTGGQAAQSVVSAFGADNMANTAEQLKAYEQSYMDMYSRIEKAREDDLISEQTAAALKLRADNQYLSQRLSGTQTFLTSLSSMQGTQSKRAAAIAKAAAIANATVDTYKAATGSYAALASIPYVGPFLGAAAATAAVIAGIANVNKIRSTNFVGFRTGGSMEVGGSGGVDSQMVAFRASPGERVTVNTPTQARALERAGENQGGQGGPPVVKVANFNDPHAAAAYLRQNPDAVLNVLSDNPQEAHDRIMGYV